MFDFGGIGFERYLLYLISEFLVVLSPGAAVILVMSRGLSQGFKASLAATAGILAANTIYFIASGLGLSVLVLAFPTAFKMLQWAGAIYIVYLAYEAWTSKPGGFSLNAGDTKSNWQSFQQALLMQLFNPKAMITFASIVPQFVNPNIPVAPQMFWLAAGSNIPEFFVLAAYGALGVQMHRWLNHPTRLRLIERCIAVLLLMIAGMIIVNTLLS